MKKILITMMTTLAACTGLFAQNAGKDGKFLVVYFSATGNTEEVAKKLAAELDAGIYKIEPEEPYTSADLDWHNKQSRTSVECNDKNSRPKIKGRLPDISGYDTIFVGYPIWWGIAPHIVLTFLEKEKVAGKNIVPFCTSGGSGIGGSIPAIKQAAAGAKVLEGRKFRSGESAKKIGDWARGYIGWTE